MKEPSDYEFAGLEVIRVLQGKRDVAVILEKEEPI
jgi:hypothetical protein